MPMNKGRIIACITSAILLLHANIARAEPIYSWRDCIELSRQNNAELQGALATEKSLKFIQNSTLGNFFPQLTAVSNSNRSYTNNANPSAPNSIYYTTHTTYVTATQNLFAGFQDMAKFEEAKANTLAARANIDITKAKVSYDLKASYQGLSYAKEYLGLLEGIIKRRGENLRIVELRFKGGMENLGSVLLAQSYLEEAKYNRLQASNLKEAARVQLCKAIGFRECMQFDIQGHIPTQTEQVNNIDLKNIVDEVPQHRQAVAQERAATAGITIARSQFFPTVNVTATGGNRGTTYLPQHDYWLLMLNVSLPFFNGGRDFNLTRSAFARQDVATHNRENVDRQVLVDLQQGYNTYIEAIARLKVTRSFRDAAQTRADIAKSKYNKGLLIFEDWDIIESDLINRETSFLQSRRDLVINEAAWEKVQGKSVYND